jgi:hypothetical protein
MNRCCSHLVNYYFVRGAAAAAAMGYGGRCCWEANHRRGRIVLIETGAL